jgi:hypothetical protein
MQADCLIEAMQTQTQATRTFCSALSVATDESSPNATSLASTRGLRTRMHDTFTVKQAQRGAV